MKFEDSINKPKIDGGRFFEKNKELISETSRLQHLLDKEGVLTWVIGGLAVATHYGGTFRDHKDIDLLVDKKQKNKFESVLKSDGYDVVEYGHKTVARKNEINIDVAFLGEQGNDLWLESYPDFKFSKADLLKEYGPIVGNERGLRVVSPELLLRTKIYIHDNKSENKRKEDEMDVHYLSMFFSPNQLKKLQKEKFDYEHYRLNRKKKL